ncbi:MAG: FkbM family methyltransferase [Bacteroidota bacterium]|jgi:FkbM family methyltransferase
MIYKIIKLLLSFKTKRSIKEKLGVPGLHASLLLLKQRGYHPEFVIDGGAYEGYWTLDFLEVFPDAKILMIEAQLSKSDKLDKIVKQYPGVEKHHCLLSDTDGRMLQFHENETASQVVCNEFVVTNSRASESLDALLERRSLPSPDFIKLDVQGFELEVLKGGENALKTAEFCLLEVSLLDIGNEPLLNDVLSFMNNRGFQAYDICQLMRRPYDNALYQIDLLFIRKDSRFIADKRWN